MHMHYATESISVCRDCCISLKLVNRLHEAGFTKWGQVKEIYANGEIFTIKGVGARSVVRLMDVKIASLNS